MKVQSADENPNLQVVAKPLSTGKECWEVSSTLAPDMQARVASEVLTRIVENSEQESLEMASEYAGRVVDLTAQIADEFINRMVDDGHIVRAPDRSYYEKGKLSDPEARRKELDDDDLLSMRFVETVCARIGLPDPQWGSTEGSLREIVKASMADVYEAVDKLVASAAGTVPDRVSEEAKQADVIDQLLGKILYIYNRVTGGYVDWDTTDLTAQGLLDGIDKHITNQGHKAAAISHQDLKSHIEILHVGAFGEPIVWAADYQTDDGANDYQKALTEIYYKTCELRQGAKQG